MEMFFDEQIETIARLCLLRLVDEQFELTQTSRTRIDGEIDRFRMTIDSRHQEKRFSARERMFVSLVLTLNAAIGEFVSNLVSVSNRDER